MSLERLASVLAATTGIDVGTLGRDALTHALRGRCQVEEPTNLTAYVERIAQDVAARSELLSELLVHETSFFRYPASFPFFLAEVRRRLAAGVPVVRILSAPCSTGQEPASLVMALLEEGIGTASVQVDAVDLSASMVARARAGCYGPEALRGLSPERRARFTVPTPEGARLKAEVQAPIRYLTGDLLAATFGADTPPYDLVLCRNLLIYLTLPARAHLLGAMRRMLAPGGALFLGHAEIAAARASGFEPAGPSEAYAVALAARRPAAPRGPGAPPRAQRARRPKPVATPAVPTPASSRAPGTPPSAAAAPASVLVQARQLAHAGHAEMALGLLSVAAQERVPLPDELHLVAVLARALGRPEEAERALTRALYLDPRHVPSLRLAALVADEQGELDKARRLRARAEREAGPASGLEVERA